MKYFFSLLLIIVYSLSELSAQQVDTISVDTAVVQTRLDSLNGKKKENWFNRDYPNPKKAALLSLILPGTGQIYNKRWWKAPLVYGAITGMVLVIDYNQSLYRRLRDALDLKRKGEEHEFTGTTIDNLSTLRNLRDSYDKNTQTAYVGLILVYTLQAMEAFVDAHLKGFDVNDDLGFRIKPDVDFVAPLGQPVIGIGLTIPLNGRPLEKAGRNVMGR